MNRSTTNRKMLKNKSTGNKSCLNRLVWQLYFEDRSHVSGAETSRDQSRQRSGAETHFWSRLDSLKLAAIILKLVTCHRFIWQPIPLEHRAVRQVVGVVECSDAEGLEDHQPRAQLAQIRDGAGIDSGNEAICNFFFKM